MQFLKFVSLFTKNNFVQLGRKWKSLPLLLLFPFLFIGLVAFIISSYFTSLGNEPLQIGLVDLDQSKETEMVVKLLEESSQLGSFLHMERVSEKEANEKINQDQMASYILFPEDFTDKLYTGKSVIVTVVGNPNRRLESYFIKELVDSAARHISSSQANILTINHYAKQLDMDTKTRNQIVQEQFNEFLLYAIGKDQALNQTVLSNNVTTSPKEYFGLAGAFLILTLWIFTIYQLLYKEQSTEISGRMMLYGVTTLQQITARIITTFMVTIVLGMLFFIGLITALDINMFQENYVKVFYLISLFSLNFLFVLAIIEAILRSRKIRLLTQIVMIGLILLTSGSVIPVIYLPLYVQDYLPLVFSNQVFNWLEEILLNGRIFVDYTPLLLSFGVYAFLLIGVCLWKERVKP